MVLSLAYSYIISCLFTEIMGVFVPNEEFAAVVSLALAFIIIRLESLLKLANDPILWLDQIGLYDFLKDPLLLPVSTPLILLLFR